jgi:RNA polymerase sigma-70 factor, ECF subfamily
MHPGAHSVGCPAGPPWPLTMTIDPAERSGIRGAIDPAKLFAGCDPLVEELYAQSAAARWGLARERFAAALARSLQKRFAKEQVTPEKLHDYLGALHIEDLALAAACIEGCEAAWEHFVATFRGPLRASASVVLRCPSGSPEASELADSLFSELYGLSDGKTGEGSLLRYFHGRSSLKTWLHAVLAQRHIDALRAGWRFESFDDGESARERIEAQTCAPLDPPPDPHRHRYLELFRRALDAALHCLEPRDAERLRLYYAEALTLAEIGKCLGEHESSVSRNLERIRRDLRCAVEDILRQGHSSVNGSGGEQRLSDVEITLCIEYASADAPIDLDLLLPRRGPERPAAGRRET